MGGIFTALVFIFFSHFTFAHNSCTSITDDRSQALYERLLNHHETPRIRQLCSSLSKAESRGPNFNMDQINEDILFYKRKSPNELSQLLEHPSVQTNEIEALDQPVSQELLSLFNDIQISVFGDVILDLKLCKNCHSFTASYDNKTVYLPPQEIVNLYTNPMYKSPNHAMAFIFAHEISHFLQNSFSLRHNHTTPSDLVYLPTADSSQMMFIGSIGQIQIINSHLHSEVDHYALEIYKGAGFSEFSDVLQWFLETSWLIGSEVNSAGDFSALMDLNFRRLQLKNSLSEE